MATFAKVWAVKTNRMAQAGETVQVTLKSGRTKDVKVDAFLYARTARDGHTSYFFVPQAEMETEPA